MQWLIVTKIAKVNRAVFMLSGIFEFQNKTLPVSLTSLKPSVCRPGVYVQPSAYVAPSAVLHLR